MIFLPPPMNPAESCRCAHLLHRRVFFEEGSRFEGRVHLVNLSGLDAAFMTI
jgi:hypothetical protein